MKIVSLDSVPREGVSHHPEIEKRVMLRPGELPHLTNFSQAVVRPGQRVGSHAHQDMSEVFFVVGGFGVIVVDGREHRLEAGVCVALSPGEAHEIFSTGPADLVITCVGLSA